MDPLAIGQKSLDWVTFLFIYIYIVLGEIQLSGVRASITVMHI